MITLIMSMGPYGSSDALPVDAIYLTKTVCTRTNIDQQGGLSVVPNNDSNCRTRNRSSALPPVRRDDPQLGIVGSHCKDAESLGESSAACCLLETLSAVYYSASRINLDLDFYKQLNIQMMKFPGGV